ncbi:MAG TPA: hypothetical protein VFI11_14285 [Anaerolineales bacterium]|nr:hypothetical protein [Anaerolineales bacterium]
MADVYAVFGTLLALGIAFPGLLTGVWLLFPEAVGRAQQRVESTPYRCLFLGLGGVVLTIALVSLFSAVPLGLVKLAGAILAFGALAVATIGAAAIVSAMAGHLQSFVAGSSPAGAFVRSAVALELAAAFPLVGWFVVLPLCLIVSVGAGMFSLFRWMPRARAVTAAEPVLGQA